MTRASETPLRLLEQLARLWKCFRNILRTKLNPSKGRGFPRPDSHNDYFKRSMGERITGNISVAREFENVCFPVAFSAIVKTRPRVNFTIERETDVARVVAKELGSRMDFFVY